MLGLIHPAIFLFNFISKRVYGVFQADGPAGVNLVENLWPELAPKTYPAQIRFKRTASDKSALRPAGVTMPLLLMAALEASVRSQVCRYTSAALNSV